MIGKCYNVTSILIQDYYSYLQNIMEQIILYLWLMVIYKLCKRYLFVFRDSIE